MSLYRERTNDSTIEERGAILVWNYVCAKSMDLMSTWMNHRGNTRKVGERLSLEKGRGRRAPLDQ
jgi:hypothetical protein